MRCERQRGSARRQMQKSSTVGKFHVCHLPILRFGAQRCAQKNLANLMERLPADDMLAARYNFQEFRHVPMAARVSGYRSFTTSERGVRMAGYGPGCVKSRKCNLRLELPSRFRRSDKRIVPTTAVTRGNKEIDSTHF